MILDAQFQENKAFFEMGFGEVHNISDGGYERGYEEARKEIAPEVDLQGELLAQVADALVGKATGYERGKKEGFDDALSQRTDLVATENGTYEPSEGSTGFKSVNVVVTGKLAQVIDRTVTEITAEDLRGVSKIGERVFWGCTSLQSVEIPEGVTSIGTQSFYDCTLLKSANIPESVTSFGTTVFQGCSSLVSINIPSGVKKIDSNVFTNCSSLPSIEIPASVTNIGYAAFSGCTALKTVILKSATPPTVNSNSFNKVPTDCIFTVPYGSGDAYKSATNWSAHADKIVEGDV